MLTLPEQRRLQRKNQDRSDENANFIEIKKRDLAEITGDTRKGSHARRDVLLTGLNQAQRINAEIRGDQSLHERETAPASWMMKLSGERGSTTS